jgi:hypothetical protein
LAARPARAPATARSGGLIGRVGALRHTSPGRLQLILAGLLVLGLLTGLLAGLTGSSTSAGTTDLGGRAQPLLVEAETIYSALADADTTAAQAFLAGGLEPPALTARYDLDLRNATTALAEAARLTPEGSSAAAAVSTLSSGVAEYASRVATARANNRQGLPIGSSYLSWASQLNRDTLLPQAQALFRTAQHEVAQGYSSASSAGLVSLFAVLLLAMLGALVLTQRHVSRTTHRTFNVPLVAATCLTVLLGLGATVLLIRQNAHLGRAGDTGSTPAAQLAEARIQVLRERGDEALTLAAHGSGGAYEDDFAAAKAILAGAIDNAYLSGEARQAYQTYLTQHEQIRKLDDGNDYEGAVKLAVGSQTSTTFGTVTDGLGQALKQRMGAFTAEIDAAGSGLGLLTILGPVLALAVCALAAVGIRARLEEYR